eukprot:1159522-Pelagomonas_calceolata.AAC.12
MFVALGRQLDRELDDIVPMLLKKAGEISNAGEASSGCGHYYQSDKRARGQPYHTIFCGCQNEKHV